MIVSDNCSGPETREIIESFNDPRIRYIRPESRLGMSEHFEFALRHANGNWVTIVGDDDGLMPHAVSRFFDIVDGTDFRVVSSLPCGFEWPDITEDGTGRLLCLSQNKGPRTQVRNSRRYLNRVIRDGYEYKELPCLYTGGFMRTDLIEEIRQKSSGDFYKSMIPDIYSGVAACCIEKNFLYSWEPLAIGGASSHSNGIQWVKKKAEETKQSHFINESAIKFHPALGSGLVQSISLLSYESYLQTAHLRNFDIDTNLTKQLAQSLLSAPPQRRDEVTDYCRNVCDINNISFDDVLQARKKLKTHRKLKKLSKKLKKISPFSKTVQKKVVTNDNSLQTVYDASIRLGEMLKL